MARRGLSPLSAEVTARVRRVRDRVLLPESTSGADQWQRVTLNAAVHAHLMSLDPGRRDAAEISGDSQAGLGWKSYTSLNFPDFDLCADLDRSVRGVDDLELKPRRAFVDHDVTIAEDDLTRNHCHLRRSGGGR